MVVVPQKLTLSYEGIKERTPNSDRREGDCACERESVSPTGGGERNWFLWKNQWKLLKELG